MAEEQKPQNWWQTVPGILTATAAIITAVTGLILALHQAGVFDTLTKHVPQAQNNTRTPLEATKPPAVKSTTGHPISARTISDNESLLNGTSYFYDDFKGGSLQKH